MNTGLPSPATIVAIIAWLRSLRPVYNSDGYGEEHYWSCPICSCTLEVTLNRQGKQVAATMEELPHEPDCAILLLIKDDADHAK